MCALPKTRNARSATGGDGVLTQAEIERVLLWHDQIQQVNDVFACAGCQIVTPGSSARERIARHQATVLASIIENGGAE